MSQGAIANYTGKELEDQVERIVKRFSVLPINYNQVVDNDVIELTDGCRGALFKNVPYTSFYGTRCRGEFVLSVGGRDDVRIECRRQTVSGSADEKLVYLFENAKDFTTPIVILIIDGDGFRKDLVNWLKDSCKSVKHKKIHVFNIEEFERWMVTFMKDKTNVDEVRYDSCNHSG